MKKLCILLLCITTSIFANPKIQYADPDKTIVVAKNKAYFTLQLKANPTTGYQWIYDADQSSHYISVVKEKYVALTTDLVGAPGVDLWTFKLATQAFVAPSKFTITLLYAKSWDLKDAPTKKEITVVTTK